MPTYRGKDGRWRYRGAFRNKRFSGSAPKSANLEKVAAKLEREHLERLMTRRYTGAMPSVAELVKMFLEYQQARVKPLTYDLHETILRVHVVPIIGKKSADDIGPRELDMLATEWAKNAAPRTINTRLGVVLRMFSVAVEWEMLHAPPKVKFLKIEHETVRFLSEAEAVALLEAAKEHRVGTGKWCTDWYPMVLVGLRTGLRIGELRGLQWGDVDLTRAAIYVQRSDPGRLDMPATSTKGNRGRVVPLSRDAIEVLRAELAKQREQLGDRWTPARLVFPAPENWRGQRDRQRARSEGNCGVVMERITARAQLKDVTWHTLRHTFASWLVMRGVPLRAVQELLGHSSIKMTEKYAHLAPGFAHASAIASLDVPLVDARPALPAPPGDLEDDD